MKNNDISSYKKVGHHQFMLVNQVSTKSDAEKIKRQMKEGDNRVQIRIVKRHKIYCIYAYGEI